ncbi:hypothetical protein B0T14DRAFT_569611 [Immersiella caudata]|uniref:CFEM domain-containing protein n=1 Tax=Immersiella caudata TaxID=314043 RepID=A0AA40BU05_9PEZI|nr:hypothetical protein B0T14DRAFT_569611 [Immersiella caudata]
MVVLFFLLTEICLSLLFGNASASDIDFGSLPDCGRPDCFPYHASRIGCPRLSRECFCGALAPVNCTAAACKGSDGYAVEDWFATQCPGALAPEPVILSRIALCARSCIRDAMIPTHCESQLTRSCFCRIRTVFEGLGLCFVEGCSMVRAQADRALASFYRQTCIYEPSADGSGYLGSDDDDRATTPDEIFTMPPSPVSGSSIGSVASPTVGASSSAVDGGVGDAPRGLSQPELLGLYIGIPASLVGILSGVIWCWRLSSRRSRGKIPGGNFFELGPPPPYSK